MKGQPGLSTDCAIPRSKAQIDPELIWNFKVTGGKIQIAFLSLYFPHLQIETSSLEPGGVGVERHFSELERPLCTWS
jgi:hypothetical protein